MRFHSFPRLLGVALLVLGVSQGVRAQDAPPPLPEGAETQTTASGLKYTVIVAGEGEPMAGPGQMVKAHYTGWLKDGGKKFDSSHDRGQPFQFMVGHGVIPGWSEGVQLMPKGAIYRFEIPPELGYGARGAGGAIPPNATLLFDIELVDVVVSPVLPEVNADAQVTLEEGLVYEILEEGEGDACGKDDGFVMHYSLFGSDGTLMESSKMSGRAMRGNVSSMRVPVLQKMPLLMKAGTILRVEASKEQGLGERSPPEVDKTFWVLEMTAIVKPLPVPEFGVPPVDELETSESGLKWKVVTPGTGESPAPTDMVTVHYAGRLVDGTVFDSSFGRGEPATFPLNGVIGGWTEGVAMMKPGETRIFVIPPDLAYGANGSPPKIGPDATLVFWIELIKIGQ